MINLLKDRQGQGYYHGRGDGSDWFIPAFSCGNYHQYRVNYYNFLTTGFYNKFDLNRLTKEGVI